MEEDVGLNIKHMAGNIYESKHFLEETFGWEKLDSRREDVLWRKHFIEKTLDSRREDILWLKHYVEKTLDSRREDIL